MTRSKGHPEIVLLFAMVCALAFCEAASAVEFAGGAGEPNNPYQIATAEQLIAIGIDPNLPSKHFKLAADIDLAGTTWATPVVPSFAGTFDGNGHTIRNLSITGIVAQGLFGFLQSSGRILNLGVVDVDVMSTSYAGALAAQNAGSVLNCYSTGAVAGIGYYTGGLVGYNQGTIASSHSMADVIGNTYVGGLVGYNTGFISDCSGTGQVLGGSRVGGLVGSNKGFLSDCGSTGQVLGGNYVGGLVGENTGSISTSYSSSNVTGSDDLGGLVGSNGGAIANCYSIGPVTGADAVGGLAGYNWGRLFSCYSTASVTGQTKSVGYLVGMGSSSTNSSVKDCYFLATPGVRGPDDTIGTPLTVAQMKQQASFVNWDFWGNSADGKGDLWFMPADAYPVLAWQTETTGLVVIPNVAGLSLDQAMAALTAAGLVAGTVSYDYHRTIPSGAIIQTYPHSFALPGGVVDLVVSLGSTYNWAENPGDGTIANPYRIQTPGQLESLGDHPELWDRHFVLSADLDMTGRTYSTALIAPDANDSASGFQGTAFTGSFNGNGQAILNLQIIDSRYPGGGYLGLFGMIGQAGQVNGLTLKDVRISGSTSYVGALAGYNAGKVVDCSATGAIAAGCGTYINGLVGSNHGSVINCHTDVTVIQQNCAVVRR